MEIEELERRGFLTRIGPEEWKVNATNADDPAELVIKLEEHPESGKRLPVGGAYAIYDGDEMLGAHGRLKDAIEEIKGWGFSFPENTLSMPQILERFWDLKGMMASATTDEEIEKLNQEWQKLVQQYKSNPENPGLQQVPPSPREKPRFANHWMSASCKLAQPNALQEQGIMSEQQARDLLFNIADQMFPKLYKPGENLDEAIHAIWNTWDEEATNELAKQPLMDFYRDKLPADVYERMTGYGLRQQSRSNDYKTAVDILRFLRSQGKPGRDGRPIPSEDKWPRLPAWWLHPRAVGIDLGKGTLAEYLVAKFNVTEQYSRASPQRKPRNLSPEEYRMSPARRKRKKQKTTQDIKPATPPETPKKTLTPEEGAEHPYREVISPPWMQELRERTVLQWVLKNCKFAGSVSQNSSLTRYDKKTSKETSNARVHPKEM